MHARHVGPYRIERDLGRGAQGAVLQAVDTRTQERVALKVLASPAERVRRRFLREGRALSSLRHPNILAVREVVDGLAPILVVDLVEGESLQARLDRDGPLPVREAIALASKLALALDYAHQVGVLHRDVKPENVLLAGGEPVLVDFGLAKLTDPSGAQSRVTEEGQFLGTPGYWSPEQASGRLEPDPRSDVYSLGATLYALLVGEPPFVAETIFDALSLVASAAPEPPSRRRPGVPPALEAICLRCLAKVPTARYPTARALAHDLEALLHAPPPPPAPPRATSKRARRGPATLREAPPRRTAVVAASVIGAALALAGAVALSLGRPEPAPAPAPAPSSDAPPPVASVAAPPPAVASGDARAILGVRALDERGAPVAGATVLAVPVDAARFTAWQERKTDADGRVLLHVEPEVGPVTVYAWTDRRHGRAGPLAATAGRVVEASVRLERPAGAGTVLVRVLADDGRTPFSGVIHYRAGPAFGMRRLDGEPWRLSRQDAPLVPIAVWGEGVAPASLLAVVEPGDTTEVALVLAPAATLTGRLLGERALDADARVHVATALGPWGLVRVADAAVRPDGTFEVRGLRPDAPHRVVVTLTGHLPIEVPDEVVASPAAHLEVRLPEAEGLVVVVEDERGAPVEGAEVAAEAGADAHAWWPAERLARTDRRGRAAWLGAPFVPDAVVVSAPGHERATVTDTLGSSFVRVRLQGAVAWSGVSGVVLDERGRALPGVVVRARTADGRALPAVVSDFSGGFRVPCPEGSRVELTFEAADRARAVRRVEASGGEATVLSVTLGPGVRVRGAVRGALAARVAGLRATGPEGEDERAVLSPTGEFDLGRLAPGRWVFTASLRSDDGRPAFHHTDVVLAGAAQEVELVIDHAVDRPR